LGYLILILLNIYIPIVNCWNDSSIDFISDFFISAGFVFDGTDGVAESIVNGSWC
jgi:hypothetical protein